MRIDPALILASLAVAVSAGIGLPHPRPRALVVPGDHSTVQAAIDAAEPGAVIRVAAGGWAAFDLRGKDVAVLGDLGAHPPRVATTSGPAVRFSGGETWRARVEGFEVLGAVECHDASPTIERNEITGGVVVRGVDGSAARPTLIRNRIVGAKTVGLSIRDASPRVLYNRIANNRAGGVFVDGGSPAFIGNEIVDNRQVAGADDPWSGGGAGIRVERGTVTSRNDVIADNRAAGPGGGVLARGTIRLEHATIANNTAPTAATDDEGSGSNVSTIADGSVTLVRSIVAQAAPSADSNVNPSADPVGGDVSLVETIVQRGDAGFVDEVHGDYRLRADATARDRATSASAVRRDFDGEPRDANPDLGADEFRARLYVVERADRCWLKLAAPPAADVFLFTERDPREVAGWTQGTVLHVARNHSARFGVPSSGTVQLPLAAPGEGDATRLVMQAVVGGRLTNAIFLTWRGTRWAWTLPGAPGERIVGLGPGTGEHRAGRLGR